MHDIYDEDYYKHGIETGKSCYFDYRWLPERTMSMAMTIIDYLGIKRHHTILDYGCSLGYLVKAFRLLHRRSFGVDISKYAIANSDFSIAQHCALVSSSKFINDKFDFCIAKDVFEHIKEPELPNVLKSINSDILFAVIPLGENGRYRAKANNFDITHVTCRNEDWWITLFTENGWELKEFTFQIKGIKDSYSKISKAHGFFILRSKKSA